MVTNIAPVKEQLYNKCVQYINQRIHSAQQAIDNARQAAAGDTKSSAGDKYETGRAMMQQEIDRNTMQLNEALKLKNLLNNIKPDAAPLSVAGAGSVVATSNGSFYLAISAGTFVIDGQTYHAVSPASPIGLKLKGLKKNDEFALNQTRYSIKEIY